MARNNGLTINNWQLGIAESPHLGFAQMVNVDIFTAPGAVKISQRLEPSDNSADVVTELIRWFVEDPEQGDVYGVDDEGKLYKWDGGTSTWSVITGHGTTGASGNGLGIWNGYLFYARSQALDVMELATGIWENDWQVLEGSNFHPMIGGQDRQFYIGNSQYVDRLDEVFGVPFDPTDPLTYSYNSQALLLQNEYEVVCLEELSTDIAIGTVVGINNTINVADTFFWNGYDEAISGSKTIRFADNGVRQMKNMGNTLFTVAGTGLTRLFASFTAQAVEVKRFNNINLKPHTFLSPKPDAIDQKDGELLIGVGRTQGTNGNAPMGVYSYRNNVYVVRHLISTGEDGSNDTLQIGSIITFRSDRYFVSWQDNVTDSFGVDVLTSFYYTEYKAYIDTALYEVGTDDDPKTYEKIEVRMGKKLNDGDGVKIFARFDLNSTFVEIAEFTTPAYLNKSVFDTKVKNLGYFKNIQFRIQLTTDVDSEESPELRSISLQ